MGAFAAGSVVLIPFPFSDLSRTKLRPAVVLAALDKGDCILCQVTSQPYDSESVTLDQQHFAEGSLQRTSFARPGKLFTAHESLLQRRAGVLTPPALHRLREKVVQTIRGESPRTIKAILWDFGGVLTSSPFESFNRFEAARGLPKDFIRGINATNPTTNAWAQFESSRVSLEEFDALFAAESAAAGHRIGGREVIGLLYGEIRPRMIAAVRACRARFKVACITNNVKSAHSPGPVVDAARAAQIAAALAEFDLVVESSVEGVRKPDPRIYLLACERLGVEPSQAVFLDDLGVNLKPAAALGMRTIKVIDEQQALAELAAITGLPLQGPA